MPKYKYRCDNCDHSFYQRRRLSERNDPTECPECGEPTSSREFTTFSVQGGSSSSSSSTPDTSVG